MQRFVVHDGYELPYEADLLYDIKTIKEAKFRLEILKSEIPSLRREQRYLTKLLASLEKTNVSE